MDKQKKTEKFKRYEADFREYLLDKYFSGKTIDGEDIYDFEVNLDGKTMKASSKPPYQSYLDDKVFDVLKYEGPGPSNGLVSEVPKKQGPRFSYDLVSKALKMQEESEPSETEASNVKGGSNCWSFN